jgi:hypothetical protein
LKVKLKNSANRSGLSRPKSQNHRSLKEDLDLVDLNQMFMKPVVAIRVLSRKREDVPAVFPLKGLTFLPAMCRF